MELTGIIFDKDGTLFDFNQTWGKWAETFLTQISEGDDNKATRLGTLIGYDLFHNRFNEHSVVIAGTPYEIAQKLIKEIPDWDINKLTKYMNHVAESIETKAATPLKPLLKRFKDNNIKLGVATNDGIDPAVAHLKSANILDLFDLVMGSDSGFGFKPGEGMLLEFCSRFKLDRSKVFMVGDSTHDLLAGKAANMRTIGVLTGIAKRDELMKYTDIVLNHIGEIPDFLISNKFNFS